MSFEDKLLAHIVESYLGGDGEDLDADTPLIDLNVIDSIVVFDLVHFLQDETGITIPIREVTLDNFATIRKITGLVARLRKSAA